MQFTYPGSQYRPLAPARRPQQQQLQQLVSYASTTTTTTTAATRMPWGEPIWTLFHVMAEQVREARFAEAREGLFQVVKLVGANLPCADCAAHAQSYLASVDWSVLRTKSAFRLFLCGFHNAVNARKGGGGGGPLFFPPEDLAARYGALSVSAVVARALFFFEGKHARSNSGLVPNSMSRDRAAHLVRAWFAANVAVLFEPLPAAAVVPQVQRRRRSDTEDDGDVIGTKKEEEELETE